METYEDGTTEPSQSRTATHTRSVFRFFFVICVPTRRDYRSQEGGVKNVLYFKVDARHFKNFNESTDRTQQILAPLALSRFNFLRTPDGTAEASTDPPSPMASAGKPIPADGFDGQAHSRRWLRRASEVRCAVWKR